MRKKIVAANWKMNMTQARVGAVCRIVPAATLAKSPMSKS